MLTQDCTTAASTQLTIELEDLAFEIFCTTYGYDYEQAYALAKADLVSLLNYASDYDFDQECQAIAASETPANDDDDLRYEVQYDDIPYPHGIGNPDASEVSA